MTADPLRDAADRRKQHMAMVRRRLRAMKARLAAPTLDEAKAIARGDG